MPNRNPISDVRVNLEDMLRESVRIDRTIDTLSLREPSTERDAMLLALRMRRADLLDRIADHNADAEAKRRKREEKEAGG